MVIHGGTPGEILLPVYCVAGGRWVYDCSQRLNNVSFPIYSFAEEDPVIWSQARQHIWLMWSFCQLLFLRSRVNFYSEAYIYSISDNCMRLKWEYIEMWSMHKAWLHTLFTPSGPDAEDLRSTCVSHTKEETARRQWAVGRSFLAFHLFTIGPPKTEHYSSNMVYDKTEDPPRLREGGGGAFPGIHLSYLTWKITLYLLLNIPAIISHPQLTTHHILYKSTSCHVKKKKSPNNIFWRGCPNSQGVHSRKKREERVRQIMSRRRQDRNRGRWVMPRGAWWHFVFPPQLRPLITLPMFMRRRKLI